MNESKDPNSEAVSREAFAHGVSPRQLNRLLFALYSSLIARLTH